MQLPYFYEPTIAKDAKQFSLSEISAKHAVQVLRMKAGESLQLTNGNGLLATAKIISADKKSCITEILRTENFEPKKPQICIAVSPTKNISRIEWLLEKTTEIGVQKIILLNCKRTEKSNVKIERLQQIIISAMLQSRQTFLPELRDMTTFQQTINENNYEEKYIAHCIDDAEKINLKNIQSTGSKIILIGPEGDFTQEEINAAIEKNFQPVSLGETRLRTETAGIAAAVLLSV